MLGAADGVVTASATGGAELICTGGTIMRLYSGCTAEMLMCFPLANRDLLCARDRCQRMHGLCRGYVSGPPELVITRSPM